MPLPEFKQLVDEARSQINEISPNDVRRMQQSGEEFTLIDVRERDEQAKGAIPGPVRLPRGILEVSIDQITTDKERKLVLYCAGGQSLRAGCAQSEEDGVSQCLFARRRLSPLARRGDTLTLCPVT